MESLFATRTKTEVHCPVGVVLFPRREFSIVVKVFHFVGTGENGGARGILGNGRRWTSRELPQYGQRWEVLAASDESCVSDGPL